MLCAQQEKIVLAQLGDGAWSYKRELLLRLCKQPGWAPCITGLGKGLLIRGRGLAMSASAPASLPSQVKPQWLLILTL